MIVLKLNDNDRKFNNNHNRQTTQQPNTKRKKIMAKSIALSNYTLQLTYHSGCPPPLYGESAASAVALKPLEKLVLYQVLILRFFLDIFFFFFALFVFVYIVVVVVY
jgi:hypothetical protein